MVLIILYRISESGDADESGDVSKKISKSNEPNKLKTKVCAFVFKYATFQNNFRGITPDVICIFLKILHIIVFSMTVVVYLNYLHYQLLLANNQFVLSRLFPVQLFKSQLTLMNKVDMYFFWTLCFTNVVKTRPFRTVTILLLNLQ